jgi:predicted RNase H-like HicB family nuclease
VAVATHDLVGEVVVVEHRSVAYHVESISETGITTEGETREHALEMLDDAVAAYRGEAGRPPT